MSSKFGKEAFSLTVEQLRIAARVSFNYYIKEEKRLYNTYPSMLVSLLCFLHCLHALFIIYHIIYNLIGPFEKKTSQFQ